MVSKGDHLAQSLYMFHYGIVTYLLLIVPGFMAPKKIFKTQDKTVVEFHKFHVLSLVFFFYK